MDVPILPIQHYSKIPSQMNVTSTSMCFNVKSYKCMGRIILSKLINTAVHITVITVITVI